VIRVLVADDQALFREGLATVLGAKGVDVVGEAKNGLEAVELATRLAPDVVLMDLSMPELDGVGATRRIAALPKAPRVIALTTFDDDASVFEALRAGAVGYLLKDVGSARLVEAIEAAARGESSLAPSVATKLVGAIKKLPSSPPARDAARDLGLSDREVAVLRGVARGLANKDIASELRIAEGTVKNHVTSILAKLSVDDRTQAAIRAKDLGIV
jgi:DNA-binding NarL/FixJ family response regulator